MAYVLLDFKFLLLNYDMYKDMFTTSYTKNSKDIDGMFKELFSPVAFLPNCRISGT